MLVYNQLPDLVKYTKSPKNTVFVCPNICTIQGHPEYVNAEKHHTLLRESHISPLTSENKSVQ